MRKLTIIILSCIIILIIPFDGFTSNYRGIRVTAKTPNGKEVPLYSGSYALVIGNGEYTKGWDPLPGAIKDVKDVTRALKENGFEVTLKTDLTRNEFNRVFGSFFYKYGRDKNNRLLIYYAGHGHTQKMATGEDLGYLVMVDAPTPEKDPMGFRLSSVDMQTIVTEAKLTKAKHVLFMFDSCFSGSILNLRERLVPEAISENIGLPVRQFITAGRGNEPVPDHSIFKQAFLDLLEGRDKEPIPDGYITGEELGLYLKNKVPEYNPAQHPQYGKIRDVRLDKGDFVFQLPSSGIMKPSPAVPKGKQGTLNKEMLFWQSIQDSEDPALYEMYVERFPNGFFVPIARKKIKALKQKTVVASIPPQVSKSKLFVEVRPKDSRVRILNIKPKFQQGMELDPGRYHVETSKQGYQTQKMWVKLDPGENRKVAISLERLHASIKPATNESQRKRIEAEAKHEREIKAKAAYQEYMARAKSFFHDDDFHGAIKTLEMLEKSYGLDKAGSDLKDRATRYLINQERNRAAELFLDSKKTKDLRKKRALLNLSYDILNALVENYPQSSLKEKLEKNISVVQREMQKIP